MRVLAALMFLASVQGADWIRVRSADVELLTDTSEKTARQTLERLARIRALLPDNATAAIPLRIYLFASEREYRRYAPAATASGFYQSGFDHDSIVMFAGPELGRAAVHEFVHFATNPRGALQPAWLREGLAEYYSNAEFRRDGVRLGAPIREHMDLLKSAKRLTAEELDVPRQDPMFYAQSWALVRDMRGEVTVPLPRVSDLHLTVDRVSGLDALLARAELGLRTGHLAPARTLYAEAERQYPRSAKVVAGLAALADAEGDRERARTLFERSLEMDDRDASAWFQLAMLTGNESALRRAAELNPELGEAQLLLGIHATDEGRLNVALEYLKRATELLPRKSYAWYSLGFAQQKAGDWEDARDSVERALRTAAAPEQTAMAQALLRLLRERGALGQGEN